MPDTDDLLMKCVITGTLFGQVTQTSLWLRNKETADISDLLAYLNGILDDFEVFLYTAFLRCCTADFTITQVLIEILNGSQPYQVIRGYTNKVGLASGPSLPPHDAGLLSLYTPFHGRRLHGRLYLPAVSETESANGLLSLDLYGQVETFGALLVSRYGATSNNSYCYVCVFSRANGVQRAPLPTPHLIYDVLAAIPITRTVPHREIATQRHRKLGRGM